MSIPVLLKEKGNKDLQLYGRQIVITSAYAPMNDQLKDKFQRRFRRTDEKYKTKLGFG